MDTSNIRPLNDHVLIERLAAHTVNPGGVLHIPDKGQDERIEGTVIATGPGKVHERTGKRIPTGVEPGDVVVINRFGSQSVPWSKSVLFIRAEHIAGVVQ